MPTYHGAPCIYCGGTERNTEPGTCIECDGVPPAIYASAAMKEAFARDMAGVHYADIGAEYRG